MITWKKIGVKGKPVYLAEWPTFVIEIHTSGQYHTPFVRMKDGAHGYGLGMYHAHDAAKREAEKIGAQIALKEAARVVVRGNAPDALGKRDRRGASKEYF